MSDDKILTYDMPEETEHKCINKIACIAWDIRGDWSDPRNDCREIVRLCNKLSAMLKEREGK